MSCDVSVIVLAFNEAESLRATATEIHAVLTRLGRPFELVIVDDGSTDDTGRIADEIARELTSTRVVHHEQNQGLGGVYRTGFATARGDAVTFFPADGQFAPDIIEQFLPRIASVDLVLGFLPASRPSLAGRTLSWVERLIHRALFGKLPRFQGIFMIRRTALSMLPLASKGRGWAIVLEMIIRGTRAGLAIESVPTTVRPRRAGVSKVQNTRTIWSNMKQLLELRRTLRAR